MITRPTRNADTRYSPGRGARWPYPRGRRYYRRLFANLAVAAVALALLAGALWWTCAAVVVKG
jgi:hypothetical protein